MTDDEFDDQLDDYRRGDVAPNYEMVGVEIVWIRDNPEAYASTLAKSKTHPFDADA